MKDFRLYISYASNTTVQTYLHAYRKIGKKKKKRNVCNFLNTFFVVIFPNIHLENIQK